MTTIKTVTEQEAFDLINDLMYSTIKYDQKQTKLAESRMLESAARLHRAVTGQWMSPEDRARLLRT